MKQSFAPVGSHWSSFNRILGALALVGMASAAGAQAMYSTPLEFLQKDGRFTFFTKLLNESGTSSWLLNSAPGGTTLFAPTDDAFAHLPQAVLDDLQKNPEALKWVVRYHIVSGGNAQSSLEIDPRTLTGETLSLTGGIPAHSARVTQSLSTGDTIVDVVDQVLISPEALKLLQRDGALPIAVGLPPSQPMTAGDVNTFDPFAEFESTYMSTQAVQTPYYNYPVEPYAYPYFDPYFSYSLWGQQQNLPTQRGAGTPPQRTTGQSPPERHPPHQPSNPPKDPGNGNGKSGR